MRDLHIVVWACTGSRTVDWQALRLDQRLSRLDLALRRAAAEIGGVLNLDTSQIRVIFAAPEYTFAGVEDGARAPAEPLPVTQTSGLFNHLERLSASHPDWLIVPGSLLFKSGTKVQNRALGYFDGESVIFAGKAFGVGEVDESRGLTFVPGDGCGKATVGGMRVALQICKDATVAQTLTERVDIHVTVGQGVGLEAIKTAVPSKVRIVADPFNAGVAPYASNKLTTSTETYDDVQFHYFTVSV